MGVSSLRRAQEPNPPATPRKPQFVRYEEHARIVQELTHKYELEILALKKGSKPDAESDPDPDVRRKPGRPRK